MLPTSWNGGHSTGRAVTSPNYASELTIKRVSIRSPPPPNRRTHAALVTVVSVSWDFSQLSCGSTTRRQHDTQVARAQ